MTTFNLKNQSRKYLYFRYFITALVLIGLISGIILVVKPSVLDEFKVNLTEDKSVSQRNIVKPNQQKLINRDNSAVNSVVDVIESKANSEEDNSIIVSTKSGKIRGKTHDVLGVKVNTFLGIPYGKEPSGKLRFRHTVEAKPWNNILNATRLPPACIQPEYTQKLFPVKILQWELSENCLFLNIWSPVTNQTSLPVVVWIHGGMFTIGSIGVDEYDGSVLASYGGVIVVSIQYRLGLFGFLDLETDDIPGNMGLWDQAMALKWIHNNIANFGGDPNAITLMGQSAGAISIGLHMMSPETKHLFKRAILQSGSPMLLNQVYGRGHKTAEEFTKKIGCLPEGTDIDDQTEMVVKCIDNMGFKKISDAQQEMVKGNPVPFLPTIPSDYVETFPTENNENITYDQKEVLIGFNENEGSLILHLAYPKNYTRTSVPTIKSLDEARDTITRMAVDGGFPEAHARSMASILLNGNATDTPENWARKIGSQSSVWGKWMGVTHHDELNYVFGVPLRYPNMFDGEDINLSKRMMKTWTHFAKTGSVSPLDYPHNWPSYDSTKPYLDLNTRNAFIGNRYHEETCNLYDALIEYLN